MINGCQLAISGRHVEVGVRAIPEEGHDATHMSSTGVSNVSICKEPTREWEGEDAARRSEARHVELGWGETGVGWKETLSQRKQQQQQQEQQQKDRFHHHSFLDTKLHNNPTTTTK
ncbi:hypothetical protein E2C01_040843 [Portunus trituberculatus]|uniref:Uncharacterized protein n=1 Tax=Portunus trituberculatus TaxID=210409 RepID=A0A5B7FQB2_PORTR|nr:hypothetical protein [Portunus trituberculatus]